MDFGRLRTIAISAVSLIPGCEQDSAMPARPFAFPIRQMRPDINCEAKYSLCESGEQAEQQPADVDIPTSQQVESVSLMPQSGHDMYPRKP